MVTKIRTQLKVALIIENNFINSVIISEIIIIIISVLGFAPTLLQLI